MIGDHNALNTEQVLGRKRPDLRWSVTSKLGADLIGRGSQFVLVYVIQRTLGPAIYGQFAYAVALGVLLGPFTDLGVQLIVTREMTRAPERAARIAGTGLTIKAVLTLAAVVLLAVVSQSRQPGVRTATFALGLSMLVASFVEYVGYVFRGVQRVDYEAAVLLAMRLVTVAAGFGVVWYGAGLRGISVAYFFGCSVGAIVGYFWLRRRCFAPILGFERQEWTQLLAQSLPLGGAIVLSSAFIRTPIFLLDYFLGPGAVGLFGVAQKLTEPLSLLPAAWMAAAFPAFTDGLAHAPSRAHQVRRRSIVGLALVGTLLAALGVLLAPWLLDVLYGGQYAGAELALRILAVALIPTFVNYALTHFLVGHDRQHLNLAFNALVLLVAAGSCAFLIPRFGVPGAAASMLIGECLLYALCHRALGGVR